MVSLGLLLGGLDSSGLSLFLKFLFSLLLSLHFVDGLNQDSLVLELVTLGQHVQAVVNVLVNLLGVSHLSKKTTKDSGAAHPQYLQWKTGLSGTSTLTNTYLVKKRHKQNKEN